MIHKCMRFHSDKLCGDNYLTKTILSHYKDGLIGGEQSAALALEHWTPLLELVPQQRFSGAKLYLVALF